MGEDVPAPLARLQIGEGADQHDAEGEVRDVRDRYVHIEDVLDVVGPGVEAWLSLGDARHEAVRRGDPEEDRHDSHRHPDGDEGDQQQRGGAAASGGCGRGHSFTMNSKATAPMATMARSKAPMRINQRPWLPSPPPVRSEEVRRSAPRTSGMITGKSSSGITSFGGRACCEAAPESVSAP